MRQGKHFSGCRCGVCPPAADKPCARQTASFSKKRLCRFFEGNCRPLQRTRRRRARLRRERCFFVTHTPQGGVSCRFAAIHLLSPQKRLKFFLCLRALGQPLAALLLYGCRILLACKNSARLLKKASRQGPARNFLGCTGLCKKYWRKSAQVSGLSFFSAGRGWKREISLPARRRGLLLLAA